MQTMKKYKNNYISEHVTKLAYFKKWIEIES